MSHLVWYITGHGFGHSTRCIAVINQLPKDIRVTVRTSAPTRLFAECRGRDFTYEEIDLDVGAVQRDALVVDVPATLRRFAEIWSARETYIDNECRWLQANAATAVVCDIPAIGVLAGVRRGLPVHAMTNFSWDWIYESFVEDRPEFAYLVDELREAYGRVDTLFRLPFAGDLSAFPCAVDTPLVARPLREPADVVRARCGVREDRRMVVLSFGGFAQSGWAVSALAAMDHIDFVLPGNQDPQVDLPDNVHLLPEGTFFHPDLVAAADALIGKLGYGIVSECVRGRTPMLYVPRTGFAEQAVFERELPRYIALHKLDPEVFASGAWSDAFCALWEASRDGQYQQLDWDGAAFIAGRLAEMTRDPACAGV